MIFPLEITSGVEAEPYRMHLNRAVCTQFRRINRLEKSEYPPLFIGEECYVIITRKTTEFVESELWRYQLYLMLLGLGRQHDASSKTMHSQSVHHKSCDSRPKPNTPFWLTRQTPCRAMPYPLALPCSIALSSFDPTLWLIISIQLIFSFLAIDSLHIFQVFSWRFRPCKLIDEWLDVMNLFHFLSRCRYFEHSDDCHKWTPVNLAI